MPSFITIRRNAFLDLWGRTFGCRSKGEWNGESTGAYRSMLQVAKKTYIRSSMPYSCSSCSMALAEKSRILLCHNRSCRGEADKSGTPQSTTIIIIMFLSFTHTHSLPVFCYFNNVNSCRTRIKLGKLAWSI